MSINLDDACVLIKGNLESDIDASGQNIDDTGAKRLAKAIEFNDEILEELDLSGNNISQEGLNDILDALKGNSSLQKFYLNWNNLIKADESEKDIDYYIKLLKKFADTGVSTIDLSCTNISINFVQALIKVIPETQLKTLFITSNRISATNKCAISNLLYVNRLNYKKQLWTPRRHLSFVYDDMKFHKMIMAVLLCGNSMTQYIPIHIWFSVFSFWRRNQFKEPEYYDDYDTTDDEEE